MQSKDLFSSHIGLRELLITFRQAGIDLNVSGYQLSGLLSSAHALADPITILILGNEGSGKSSFISRFVEQKRAVKDKHLGPLIKTHMTRCIHCTRCIRFSEEIAGNDQLGTLNRGEDTEITSFLEKAIDSEMSANVIDLCPVGALTSKPYEYLARPWELKKTQSIDVFDAVGSNVRIDSKADKILRVLPRINEDINEEWISDKTRYAIDGLSKQRLDKVYIRENNKLEVSNWDSALNKIIFEINNRKKENTIAVSGKFTDVETLFSTKNFLNSIGSSLYECRFDNSQFLEGQRSSYILNSSIKEIENADSILLVGSNPRWEASVLNARIRKAYIQNNCKIGLIGNKLNLNYEYEHLSNSISHLNEILNGESSYCKILERSQNPLIIIGISAINYSEGKNVLNLSAEIAKKLINKTESFNPLNILQQNISRVGALDINFYNSIFDYNFEESLKNEISNKKPVVFLLGQDEINFDLLKGSFVVYLGHHGDKGAACADIVLPAPAYTEKNSTYVNAEGRIIQTSRSHNPLGEAKEEWKIFRALSDSFNKKLKFNNLNELRNDIVEFYPAFKNLFIEPTFNKLSFGSKVLVKDRNISYNIENFYMTDSISRSSETMAHCTKEILNKVTKSA